MKVLGKLQPNIDKYDNRSAHSREGSKVMGCVQSGMHISLCRKEGANGTVTYKYDIQVVRNKWGFMFLSIPTCVIMFSRQCPDESKGTTKKSA